MQRSGSKHQTTLTGSWFKLVRFYKTGFGTYLYLFDRIGFRLFTDKSIFPWVFLYVEQREGKGGPWGKERTFPKNLIKS